MERGPTIRAFAINKMRFSRAAMRHREWTIFERKLSIRSVKKWISHLAALVLDTYFAGPRLGRITPWLTVKKGAGSNLAEWLRHPE